MLIIGHRGAAGLAPENTLEALHAGVAAGADMLEFDVRLTKDNVPILAHDTKIHGHSIRQHTLSELQKEGVITELEVVLKEFFGKILLNIELKHEDSTLAVYSMVRRFIASQEDWDNVLFSSFRIRALRILRVRSRKINIALLQHANPFYFILVHRELNLTAVGFHRLFANTLAIATAKELGIFTYTYTVNRTSTAQRLQQRGIDGIVTDYPNKIAH